MRIDNGKLVGAYVSDVQTSGRNTIYTISDSDNTPTREFTTYEYVQTEQLARMGISVNPNGAITVDNNAYQNYQRVNNINTDSIPFCVKFKGALYACDLTDALENGATLEFVPIASTSYPKIENDIKIPAAIASMAGKVLTVNGTNGAKAEWKDVPEELPDTAGNSGKVLTVNSGGTGVEWDDVPKELPAIASGDAGKVLTVNAGETGTEWANVPNELPAIGDTDAGKVLTVNSGHTGTEWGSIPNELPAIGSGDAGKVLKVNAGETGVEWGAGGGGQTYYHIFRYSWTLYSDSFECAFWIRTNTNTPMTIDEAIAYLINNGFTSATNFYPMFTGTRTAGGNAYPSLGIYAVADDDNLYIVTGKNLGVEAKAKTNFAEYAII